MHETKLVPGLIVYSKAGRDAGRYYVVCEVLEGGYVLTVDGQKHRMDNKKRKKCKHLTLTNHTLEGIGEKFSSGKQVFDSELRKALRPFNNEEGAIDQK
ncbi:MAG: KOW domain-containing RNA-binding protein [Clostridia bacterium]|nr:KOW domain-containing RNA-binding protein [Clostridia bacterium]